MSTEEDLSRSFDGLGIPSTHSGVGLSNLIARNKQYRSLFTHKRLPETGWSDTRIEHLLLTLSSLDTNGESSSSSSSTSDERWCGVGEREGRVYSSLVARRHFGMSHGVGRSGDVTEAQPKAVGSTAVARLATALVLDAVRRGAGLDKRTVAAHAVVLPLCTGMSASLTLSALYARKRERDERRRRAKEKDDDDDHDDRSSRSPCVLWCRIDQKSCLKAISTAGLRAVVVPTVVRNDDEVVADLDALREVLARERGAVVAVVSTTSCFAPRVPDPVDEIARICAAEEEDVAHVVNHAYGLQCAAASKLLNRAATVGRVDAVVFSTDKNFLVPVGGAVVLSPDETLARDVGRTYAGRASASPIVDLFATLLSMGLEGYRRLLRDRTELLETTFRPRLEAVAAAHGERLLRCPSNTISFGVTLDSLSSSSLSSTEETQNDGKEISYLGSMLFTRCVSGTRVVPRCQSKVVCGLNFEGFGSSTDDYPHHYLTAACAIGLTEAEVVEFASRLDKALRDFKKKRQRKRTEKGKNDNSKNDDKKAAAVSPTG